MIDLILKKKVLLQEDQEEEQDNEPISVPDEPSWGGERADMDDYSVLLKRIMR